MINIAVDKSGAVSGWKRNKSPCPQLSLVLSNRFRLDTNLPVYISGDDDTLQAPWSMSCETVRRAGVQKVAFMVGDAAEQARPNHENPLPHRPQTARAWRSFL